MDTKEEGNVVATHDWDRFKVQADSCEAFQQNLRLWEALGTYRSVRHSGGLEPHHSLIFSRPSDGSSLSRLASLWTINDTLILGQFYAVPSFQKRVSEHPWVYELDLMPACSLPSPTRTGIKFRPLASGVFSSQSSSSDPSCGKGSRRPAQAANVGSIMGCFMGAYLVDKIGCRRTLLAALVFPIPFIGMAAFVPSLPSCAPRESFAESLGACLARSGRRMGVKSARQCRGLPHHVSSCTSLKSLVMSVDARTSAGSCASCTLDPFANGVLIGVVVSLEAPRSLLGTTLQSLLIHIELC